MYPASSCGISLLSVTSWKVTVTLPLSLTGSPNTTVNVGPVVGKVAVPLAIVSLVKLSPTSNLSVPLLTASCHPSEITTGYDFCALAKSVA